MTGMPHVGVFGAGAIGGYLGVCLSAAGARVTLLGRRSLVEARPAALWAQGLDGVPRKPSLSLRVSDAPEVLGGVDVCLVTVKSRDTKVAAETLAHVLSPGTLVVSLQNGLHNATHLRAALTEWRVLSGVVTFNVFRDAHGGIHQATRGKVFVGRAVGGARRRALALCSALQRAGIRAREHRRIEDVLAGKLLLNLNNGICAATGLTIHESIQSFEARQCFAQCLREGLRVMRAADRKPVSPLVLPLWLIPWALQLPNAVLARTSTRLLGANPEARSSTLQDLLRGKPTEIDALNGELLALASRIGLDAPLNRLVVNHVHAHEEALERGAAVDFVTPQVLYNEMQRVKSFP